MKYDVITCIEDSEKDVQAFLSDINRRDPDSVGRLIFATYTASSQNNDYCFGDYSTNVSFAPIGKTKSEALNNALNMADSEYTLFLNIKSKPDKNTIARIKKTAERFPQAVGIQLATWPTEGEINFDPVELTTDILDFDCCCVKTQRLKSCGGFDKNFDALYSYDASIRLSAVGDMKYCADAALYFEKAVDEKKQYIQGGYEKLLLACKYGAKGQLKEYLNMLKNPRHFPSVRKELALLLAKYIFKFPFVSISGRKYGKVDDISKYFSTRRGQMTFGPLEQNPLVSIVVRTHKRKEVLRRTLSCLYNQTYKNFEVVVVEDGENTAEEMVKTDFPGLNIRYFSTGEHVGRGRAGNIGIEKAQGEYVCFLDDDDYLYPDYIAANLYCFEQNDGVSLITSSIMAARADIVSTDPYVCDVKEYYPVIFDHITLMDMCVKCRIPITGAMFRKEMYNMYKGMREDIDADEDWAMWLKFMAYGKRADLYHCDIPRALSMFLYPADDGQAARREEKYRVFDQQMLYDPTLVFTVEDSEIKKWEDYVHADILHLKNTGQLENFVKNLNPLGCRKLDYQPGKNTVTAGRINSYYYYLVNLYTENT